MFIDKISRSPYNERKQGESSMQSTKTNYEMKQYNFQTVFKIIFKHFAARIAEFILIELGEHLFDHGRYGEQRADHRKIA